MTTLTAATAALVGAKDAFDGYLGALDEPGAIESLGFKRENVKRLFSDANPNVAYPGGTSMADATVTHSFVFSSSFPDEETKLFFIWGVAVRVDSNGDENFPNGLGAITLSDGTILTNIVKLGIELNGTSEGFIRGVMTASGKHSKPAGTSEVVLEQRCYMEAGEATAVMELDSADILIWEVVK